MTTPAPSKLTKRKIGKRSFSPTHAAETGNEKILRAGAQSGAAPLVSPPGRTGVPAVGKGPAISEDNPGRHPDGASSGLPAWGAQSPGGAPRSARPATAQPAGATPPGGMPGASVSPVPAAPKEPNQEASPGGVIPELASLAHQAKLAEGILDRLEQIAQTKEALIASAREDVISLVFMIICKIAPNILRDRGGLAAVVDANLAQMAKANGAIILLNPDDYHALAEIGVLATSRYQEMNIRFEADTCVGSGGCIVKGMYGTLDSRLETVLKNVMAYLTNGRR